jgi:hypothetical protein
MNRCEWAIPVHNVISGKLVFLFNSANVVYDVYLIFY